MHLDLLPMKGYPMKRLILLGFAVAAVTMMTESSATAQGYYDGYQFGAGINAAHGFVGDRFARRRGFVGFNQFRNDLLSFEFRRAQPPYFAKFPPVYYSHPVKRPYGISPYAVPGGIAPVEMGIPAPIPLSVKNPYFQKGTAPAKTAKPKSDSKTNMKTTWVENPYLSDVAVR